MKKVYEAPQIEVFEVKVEEGFAQSNASLERPDLGGDVDW